MEVAKNYSGAGAVVITAVPLLKFCACGHRHFGVVMYCILALVIAQLFPVVTAMLTENAMKRVTGVTGSNIL